MTANPADPIQPAEVPDSFADGVLTTAAAVAMLGRGHVRNQLAAGRWQRPVRGVVVLHNGPVTQRQRDWVALLAAAPGSALGGVDALRHDGLTGFDPAPAAPVSVTLPPGSRRPARELVRALVRAARIRRRAPTSYAAAHQAGAQRG